MKKHSISISLSLRFMLIISAATIFLSLSIIFLVHRFSRSEKNRELLRFTEESCAKIQAFGIENELLDLPYHISYGIFDKKTGTAKAPLLCNSCILFMIIDSSLSVLSIIYSTFFMEDLYKKCMENSMLVTIAKSVLYIL